LLAVLAYLPASATRCGYPHRKTPAGRLLRTGRRWESQERALVGWLALVAGEGNQQIFFDSEERDP
jgi:hypothetical protein